MKNLILAAALICGLSAIVMKPAYAQAHDDHAHEQHDETANHSDHEEHDDHDHSDETDEHGHEGHDDHEEHEKGRTEIAPEAAKKAGVLTSKAGATTIAQTVSLTGRITINQNAIANVRTRFPGIIRSVKANLGDKVEKGQVLAVVEANESLQNYNVTAPISGVILKRSTNLGDVSNDEPLFVVADLSEVWAKFHIFPKDADKIRSGQNVHVYTLDNTGKSTAKITMLFPTADELSQTLVAIVPLSNEQGGWRPGMIVEGGVVVSEKQVNVAVRTSALQTMENQNVVFIRNGNSYEQIAVQTGLSDGEHTEILSGLNAGQDYVREGSFVIKADILKAGAEHVH